MESTGKYWIPVYNILELSCNIVLPHPKYVKAIKGKKTDKRDAKWIADLFKHDLINGSFIPPADIHQLRDLTRYRNKLTNFIVGEKNRAQNCLTVSNIKLDDVFILWLDFYLQDSCCFCFPFDGFIIASPVRLTINRKTPVIKVLSRSRKV